MSLVPVFSAIKTQLLAEVSNVTPFTPPAESSQNLYYVQMWNNQLELWRAKAKAGKLSFVMVKDSVSEGMYDVVMPAILIEFVSESLDTEELGGGYQIYPNLLVRIHLVHQQLDAGDGTMEQNLEVFQLADAVHLALNKFKPAGCVEFIRKKQKLDSAHDMLYHYIIDYATNYVDNLTAEPIGGVTIPGDTITPVITESYDPAPYIKPD